MLQRIQTVYLILVVIIAGILPFIFPLWQDESGLQKVYFMQEPASLLLFAGSFTLAIVSIFSYKKRQNQFVLNRLNIILNLILLGLFVYRSLTLSGETEVSEKGIGIFLPIAAVVCLVLANRATKKDEDLVKSVDRLR
jgi:peptidoglycan/LPS O-acetylase OafA/YrhL